MVLLKFGQEEHLRQLKEGIVHFSPLVQFIEDSTDFRGDPLEASILYDLSQPFLINGRNIIPYVKEIKQSYAGFDSILTFSAAKLDHSICHMRDDGLFVLNDDFVTSMEQFGSYVLIFPAKDFVFGLEKALKMNRCNYVRRPIFYCDKSDHTAIAEYLKSRTEEEDPYGYCFIKDRTPYAIQNEWRFIIHDVNNEFQLKDNGGVNIQTGFRARTPIFETTALRELVASEDFLG